MNNLLRNYSADELWSGRAAISRARRRDLP